MRKNNIEFSPLFRSLTIRAIISIALFMLTYIIILIIATYLTLLCIYGGVIIIPTFPSFMTIVFGIGLASFGVLILIFLLKFIFKSHKVDLSHLYEIKKGDEQDCLPIYTPYNLM